MKSQIHEMENKKVFYKKVIQELETGKKKQTDIISKLKLYCSDLEKEQTEL